MSKAQGKKCKNCGRYFDDDESYDICFGCHQKAIGVSVRVVDKGEV